MVLEGVRRGGGYRALFGEGEGVGRRGAIEFVGEGVTSQGRGIPKWRRPSSWMRGMTSQGKEDLKNFKMAPRAQLEFVGEEADVTGEGEDFQNLKMALRAFRIGATYWMFEVLWVRVGIWARLGKISRFFIHFILTPPIGCYYYYYYYYYYYVHGKTL